MGLQRQVWFWLRERALLLPVHESVFSSSKSGAQCWAHPGAVQGCRMRPLAPSAAAEVCTAGARLAGLCAAVEFPRVQSSAADFVPRWKTLPLAAFRVRFHSCRREGFSSFSLSLFLLFFFSLPFFSFFGNNILYRKKTNKLTARSPG